MTGTLRPWFIHSAGGFNLFGKAKETVYTDDENRYFLCIFVWSYKKRIMKRNIAIVFMGLLVGIINAQKPFKRILHDAENNIFLHIDLYEESINVPGMDMFGPMNGYMSGNIYGVWMVTSFKIEDDKTATIRLSNDQGADTQEAELKVVNDSTYDFRQKDGVVIKKVVGRSLVKIPRDLTFRVRK